MKISEALLKRIVLKTLSLLLETYTIDKEIDNKLNVIGKYQVSVDTMPIALK
jgi:hypothetical protein|tara:strand:- start:208 stop:363 length:156 start_codon:yes stop_codon:yes gene_type:complete